MKLSKFNESLEKNDPGALRLGKELLKNTPPKRNMVVPKVKTVFGQNTHVICSYTPALAFDSLTLDVVVRDCKT